VTGIEPSGQLGNRTAESEEGGPPAAPGGLLSPAPAGGVAELSEATTTLSSVRSDNHQGNLCAWLVPERLTTRLVTTVRRQ
jgi:hypothetical protein